MKRNYSIAKVSFIGFYILLIALYIIFAAAFRNDNFYRMCVISTIFIFISVLVILFFKRRIIDFGNILYIIFILFQFGLPILKAFNKDFYNYYLTEFTEENLIICTYISCLCILFYGFGLLIFSKHNENFLYFSRDQIKYKIISDSNKSNIISIMIIVGFFTGIVSFSLALANFVLSLIYGYEYIKTDPFNLTNSLTNFCNELFIPCILILLIFSNSKKIRKIVFLIGIVYSILLILSGARTYSIGLLATLALFIYIYKMKKNVFKTLMFLLFGLLLIIVVVRVAQIRHYHEVQNLSIFSIFESLINEMGFNFTSICFTRLYVPNISDYAFGMSYLYSFICLIPKSLDPSGFINYVNGLLPEIWLSNMLKTTFGTKYDFGVGFSVIAEGYYNFGFFAFVPIFLQSLLINWIFSRRINIKYKNFSIYIKLILFYSLFTYPRRSFITLLKSLEYNILLVFVIIILMNAIIKSIHEKSTERNYLL